MSPLLSAGAASDRAGGSQCRGAAGNQAEGSNRNYRAPRSENELRKHHPKTGGWWQWLKQKAYYSQPLSHHLPLVEVL